MKPFGIHAPAFQNWSCHGCTNCCRGGLLIQVSAEEKRRIEALGWSQADGVASDTVFVMHGDRFHLGHQSDGACVFLNESGRCRIHARFGEEAKPLACRLYPLAIHPAGKKLVVSLRFDCPSAARNQGKPMTEQVPAIRRLAELVVPAGYREGSAPPVLRAAGLGWVDFLRYVSYLDETVADCNTPIALKLLRALLWLKAVEKARFDQLAGGEADEILSVLCRSAEEKLSAMPVNCPAPTRLGHLIFRTVVFDYVRMDTVKELQAGGGQRRRRLGALLRFARGTGRLPVLQPRLKDIEFAAVECLFGLLPSGGEAMLTRYFRVKIQGLHFCGRACYDLPLIEGFRSLALVYPVILWLAHWLAAGDDRSTLSDMDIAQAITIADHHHGYSPLLGTHGFRWRVRLLARRDDISRLCSWYSR